jgi:hypothetical protein
MMYREIIAICTDIHTEYINTLCRPNVEMFNVKLLVHTVTTRLWSFDQAASVVSLAFFLQPLIYTSDADDLYHYATQCHVTHRHTPRPVEQSQKTVKENVNAPIQHGRLGDALSHTQHRLSVQEQVQPVCKDEVIHGSKNKDKFIINLDYRRRWAVSLPRRI